MSTLAEWRRDPAGQLRRVVRRYAGEGLLPGPRVLLVTPSGLGSLDVSEETVSTWPVVPAPGGSQA